MLRASHVSGVGRRASDSSIEVNYSGSMASEGTLFHVTPHASGPLPNGAVVEMD